MSNSARKEIEQSTRMWIHNEKGQMDPITGYGSYEEITTPTKGVTIINFFGFDETILTTQGSQVFTEIKPKPQVKEGPAIAEKLSGKEWNVTTYPEPKYDRSMHEEATSYLLEKLGITTVTIPPQPGRRRFHKSKIVEICLDPRGTQTLITWLNAHKKPRVTEARTPYIIATKTEQKSA